jgi:gliding motility-associated-like protein
MNNLTKRIFSILIFNVFVCVLSQAQSVVLTPLGPGQNSFMQGVFLEVGVSSCGTYGTESVAAPVPPGFHARGVLDGLGFVADPGRNGWSIPGPGSNPDYCGDYFLPGSPVEGWGIEVNSNSQINSDRCGIRDINGSVISGVNAGGVSTTIWEGTTTGIINGLFIRQTTTIPDSALYFVTKVEMTNTSSVAMSNVYYARNVDPDNDQPISGDFTTTNTIVSQPNASECDALVTAVGLSPGCFLGIGARSQNARVCKGSFSTTPPISSYYTSTAGHDTFTGHVSTADEAISISFYWPTIAPGQTVTATFAHILNPADLATALEATGGAFIFSDSLDITPTLTDTICPNDPKELIVEADTSYRWSWSPAYHISTTVGPRVIVNPDTTTTYVAVGINGPCGVIVRTITIYVDSGVNVNAGPDDSICLGQSTTLRATRASFFTWSPGASLSSTTSAVTTATPSVTTTYRVASNCGIDSVKVFVAPDFKLNLIKDTALCWRDSIQLFATPTIGSPSDYTYAWRPTSSFYVSNIRTPWASVTSDTRFNVHVKSNLGCEKDTFVNMTVRGYRPNVDVTKDTFPVCFGDTLNLYSTVRSSTCNIYTLDTIPAYSLPGSGTALVLSDDELSSAIPLGFDFDFFCNTFSNIYVSSNGFISFDPFAGSGCCSGQFLPSFFAPNAVIAGAWQDLSPLLGANSIEYKTAGTAPNRLFAVDFNDVPLVTGADRVKFEIVLHERTNIIDINTTYAGGFSFAVSMGIENDSGTVGYAVPGRNASFWNVTVPESYRFTPIVPTVTYSWMPPYKISTTHTPGTVATVDTGVLYTLFVDDSGCVGKDTITVRQTFVLPLTPLYDTAICCSQFLQLDPGVIVGGNYVWSPSGDNTSTVFAGATGTYSVTVTAPNGCTATEAMNLQVFCIDPVITATPDTVIVNNASQFSVTTTYDSTFLYNWIPSTYLNSTTISNPVATPNSTDPTSVIYTVTVSDLYHGCVDTASITLYIQPNGFYAFPDAFTPNGDGVNDQFYPVINQGVTIESFKIFNRWGDMVYDSPSKPGWNGKFLNADQPVGTYIYYVKLSNPDPSDGSRIITSTYNGVITLIR